MTVADLNVAIADGSIDEIIRVAEARQRKALSKIADAICAQPDVRLVLVAGGSAAGKTTTAQRLATQLRVNERAVLHLSTDDYFVGDRLNPRDENGDLDYEHVDCVDRAALANDLNSLFRGEKIRVRRFDFIRHEPVLTERTLTLPSNGLVIVEGIHALNPLLSEGVTTGAAYRVFVEPKPTIEVFFDIVPRPDEARFLRRLVRDNQFRKMEPAKTLTLWPKVLAGEKKWIEPFRGTANVTFDSYLCYELAVLKPYAGGLLERAHQALGDRREILNMIRLLSAVEIMSPENVPGDSILRETIGNSQLTY